MNENTTIVVMETLEDWPTKCGVCGSELETGSHGLIDGLALVSCVYDQYHRTVVLSCWLAEEIASQIKK